MQLLQVATLLGRKQNRKEGRRNRNVQAWRKPSGGVWRKAARDLAAGRIVDVWFKARLITCVEDEYIRKSNSRVYMAGTQGP